MDVDCFDQTIFLKKKKMFNSFKKNSNPKLFYSINKINLNHKFNHPTNKYLFPTLYLSSDLDKKYYRAPIKDANDIKLNTLKDNPGSKHKV